MSRTSQAIEASASLPTPCIYIGLRGKEPNGPEEQAEQAQFDSDQGYKAALLL